jgi:hypothetical protein
MNLMLRTNSAGELVPFYEKQKKNPIILLLHIAGIKLEPYAKSGGLCLA